MNPSQRSTSVNLPGGQTLTATVLIASSVLIATAGCAMPGLKRLPGLNNLTRGLGPDRVVVDPPEPTTLHQSASRPAVTGSSATTAAPGTSDHGSTPVQPVAYVASLSSADCGCGNAHESGAAGCLAGSSAAAHPPSLPYGYAPQPTAFNAYGIDPQEFLCDGGDQPPAAMLDLDDTLAGLQPEDTVVHYTTEAGDIGLEASNRVCVYAPRFASVRKITGAASGGRAIAVNGFNKPVGPNRLELDQPGLVMTETTELGRADASRGLDAMRVRNRGVPIEGVLQPLQAEEVLAAVAGLSILELHQMRDTDLALVREAAQAAVTWTIDESVEVAIEDLKPPTLTRDQSVEGLTVYDFPEAGRLQVLKLADRNHAKPGEIVNFAIRIDNVGDSPVTNVVLTDNLTTRLVYIEGSQTCSKGAEFDTEINDGQSLRLQWTLTDELKVGENTMIRFQCRVR